MIPLKDCKKGYFYRIRARNFQVGIFDGNTGFIGIREKFGDRYLVTEYHWDIGAPLGTVRPVKELGIYGMDFSDEEKMFEFLKPIQEKINEERRKEYDKQTKKWVEGLKKKRKEE